MSVTESIFGGVCSFWCGMCVQIFLQVSGARME